MPRTGGEKTRMRVLRAAEELFSKNGFDGTGMEAIARAAGINKASIYYHFKNKNEIISSLFRSILEDSERHLAGIFNGKKGAVDEVDEVMEEIEYLSERKKILTIFLMESLKNSRIHKLLFQCAEQSTEMEGGYWSERHNNASRGRGEKPDRMEILSYEFFTGFIPILAFVIFREKWCAHYRCSDERLLKDFVAAFKSSHIGNYERYTKKIAGDRSKRQAGARKRSDPVRKK
jgi:AcrR family transcriptional regulator